MKPFKDLMVSVTDLLIVMVYKALVQAVRYCPKFQVGIYFLKN